MDDNPIIFIEADAVGLIQPYNDAIVISVMITNFIVHRVLVDNGSSTDILLSKAYNQLGVDNSSLLLCPNDLFGFAGDRASSAGIVTLPFTMGDHPSF